MPARPAIKPFQIIIPGAHPALADHFAGHPIVPGALLLSAIHARLGELIGHSLCEISKLRFNHAVLPDQAVKVHYEQKTAAQWRFRGSVDGQTVIKGIFHGTGGTASEDGRC